MKKAVIAVALIGLVLLSYNSASACMSQDVGDIVYQDVGIIEGEGSVFRSFVADVAPFRYLVTLTDLSFKPQLGFSLLGLVLLDANGIIDTLFGPGEFAFDAVENQRYFVNVFGEGAGDFGAGVFGVEITAVPIPGAALLLGSGLFGLALVRRRKH